MTLFISDIHFGRRDDATERRQEADLIACLRAHADAERLYLLGDIFDQYIEYRHLIPKGFVRFQAVLAEWTDQGREVIYLVGNHDPWHRSYFERELGVRILAGSLHEPLHNLNVYMTHGDGIDPGERWYRRLKPWLRHRVPVWMYTTLLPGDSGFSLARWVNHRMRDEQVKPAKVAALRAHARRMLTETDAEVAVMGHSHFPEHHVWPEGQYLNLGSWYETRTFVRLDEDGPKLLRWNDHCLVEVV